MQDLVMQVASANPFKSRLTQGEPLYGYWSSLAHPVLAEIAAGSAFDWMLFDAEHAPNDVPGLLAQLQAIRYSGKDAVVRPPRNHDASIKPLLDIGFRNLLIPNVRSADEAREAVAATRYPPGGRRGVSAYHRNNGYGRDADYFRVIDQAMVVIAQIESLEGMAQLESIASVTGVDALFVGPGDLAASLQRLGQVGHADVQDAIREIGRRARQIQCPLGIAAGNADDVARYRSWGYGFFTVGSDVALFRQAVDMLAASVRASR